MKWSDYEVKYLIDNYAELGPKSIGEKIGRSFVSVTHKANRLGIKISKERKSKVCSQNSIKRRGKKENYRVDDITNNINEYSSYLLGLIWTDGYLSKNRNTVGITMVSDDLNKIEWIFYKTGNWYKQSRKRKGKRESTSLDAYNPNLYDSLCLLGFLEKSKISPFKVFEIIPKNYIKYFFRGIIDGDGCFYVNKRQYTYQFSICSTYDQDWSFYIYFFKNKFIDFKIKRRIQNKKSRSSIIQICKKSEIKELIYFVYDGYDSDKIGLKRKYDKAMSILK